MRMKKLISHLMVTSMVFGLCTNMQFANNVNAESAPTVELSNWTFLQGGASVVDVEAENGNWGFLNSVVMNGTGEEITGWLDEGEESRGQTKVATESSDGFTLDIKTNGWDAMWNYDPTRINPWSIQANMEDVAIKAGHTYRVSFKASAEKRKYGYVKFESSAIDEPPYGEEEFLYGDNQIITLGTEDKTFTYEFTNWSGVEDFSTRLMFGAFTSQYDFDGNDISDIIAETETTWSGTVSVSNFKIEDLGLDPAYKEPEINGTCEGEIQVDEVKALPVDGTFHYYTFTPEKTANYTFYSLSNKDTYGILYDKYLNEIAEDDDSGEDSNFSIDAKLKKGYTYILFGRLYDENDNGSIDVCIEENKIDSISFELAKPIELIENVDGDWCYDDDDDDNEYFEYDTPSIQQEGNQFTVNYTDGTKDVYIYQYNEDADDYDFYTSDGKHLNEAYKILTNQDTEHWTLGSDNYMTLSFHGHSTKIPVTIASNPVYSISFKPAEGVTLYENVDGDWCYDDDDEKYFDYNTSSIIYAEGSTLTVYYKDGRDPEVFTYGFSEEDDHFGFYNENGEALPGDIEVKASQYKNHWTLGSDNYCSVSYMNKSDQFKVTVSENPVKEISFNPEVVTIYEGIDGYYEEDDYGEEYYEYDTDEFFKDGYQLTVKFKNGSEKIYTYSNEKCDFLDEDGSIMPYEISKSSNQYKYHWTVGDDNYLKLTYMGKTTEVQINIVKNPVSSINFEFARPLVYNVEYDGEWDEDNYGNEFFRYNEPSAYEVGNKLTINYKDGTKKVYTAEKTGKNDVFFYDEDHNLLTVSEVEVKSSQSDTPWVMDSENELTVSYCGASVTLPVSIVEMQREFAGTLTLNETVEATVNSNNRYYIFTPREDGAYHFEATGDDDTYAELLNSDFELLESCDDNGANVNFSFDYEMEAGVSYVFWPRFYQARQDGTISFTVTKVQSDSEEETSTEEVSTEEVSTEEVSTEASSQETNTNTETTSADETTSGEVSTEETSATEETTTKAVVNLANVKVKKAVKKKSAKKVKITLSKTLKGVDGYEVRFYGKKKLAKKNKNAILKVFVEKNKKVLSVSNKKLKKKKTLFVRVRGFKKAGKGKVFSPKWSAVKKVKVK